MIEALALIHIWSLMVAGVARHLQRDREDNIGSHFPAPETWLILVSVSVLPGAIFFIPFIDYLTLPSMHVFEVDALPNAGASEESLGLPSFLTFYFVVASAFAARTLWHWLRLQRLPLKPTAQIGVFSTPARIPPLTLSWPKRAIVIPDEIETSPALIRHERAHLQHHDGELTLILLLLQDLLLRNPGIDYLIKQWRLAVELRADQVATQTLSTADRKAYATMLLNGYRPKSRVEPSLPCPTAHLCASEHRSVKMRLLKIMEHEPKPSKPKWRAVIVSSSCFACIAGLATSAVSAEGTFVDLGLKKVDYATQVSPTLPEACPSYELEDIDIQETMISVDGRRVAGYKVRLGTVILQHDVRRNGSVHNPQVLDSTNPCFEAEAAKALKQWVTAPQPHSLKGAVVKMHFGFSETESDKLKEQIESFRQ